MFVCINFMLHTLTIKNTLTILGMREEALASEYPYYKVILQEIPPVSQFF